jgi:copper homeostasis protein
MGWTRPIVEVCVEGADSAIVARRVGADRVELCADLLEGGTTPSLGTIELVREHTLGGLFVMIRPRGGDFRYSESELDVMARDIDCAKRAGADGVVLGLLRRDGTIDTERTAAFVERARPMQVTFHRAFDMSRDPWESLEQLIALGVDRVLTSGQRDLVPDGLELLAELVRRAGDRIVVMPGGGGVSEANIRLIAESTGAREVHFAALATVPSGMEFRNPQCTMGAPVARDEYELCETDPARVRSFLDALA